MGLDHQTEVITLLKDLQKKVGYLEKKIDLLSGVSSDRKFSKPRNYPLSSSSRTMVGTRPSSGGSRYKSKYESSYSDKKSSPSKWYEKKRGDDLPAGRKKKRPYKPLNKRSQRPNQ